MVFNGLFDIDSIFNKSQNVNVEPIAWMCPAEGGRVVHMARELYHQFINNTIYFDDDSLCIVPQLRLASLNNEKSKVDSRVSIYPNPTYDELNIKYSFEADGIHSYKILDVTNRLQLQRELPARDGVETISLSTLQQGSYLLLFYSDNHIIFTEKIIVIR